MSMHSRFLRPRSAAALAMLLVATTMAAAFPAPAGAAPRTGARPGATQHAAPAVSHRGPALHGLARLKNGSAPAPRSSASSNLVDQLGPILPTVHPYAIWWGPKAAFPPDASAAMTSFFGGLSGSAYLAIANQYLRGASASVAKLTNIDDPSTPTKSESQASIAAEVAKVVARHPDPAGIYFVFTSTPSHGGSYCAWHASTLISGRPIAYAYMPNVSGVRNCDPGDRFGANTLSERQVRVAVQRSGATRQRFRLAIAAGVEQCRERLRPGLTWPARLHRGWSGTLTESTERG